MTPSKSCFGHIRAVNALSFGKNTAALGEWAGKLSPDLKERAKDNLGVVSEMHVLATCYLIDKQFRGHGQ